MSASFPHPALGRHEPATHHGSPADLPSGGPEATLIAATVCGVFVWIPTQIMSDGDAMPGGPILLLFTAFVTAGVVAATQRWRDAHRDGLRLLAAVGAVVLALAAARHAGGVGGGNGVIYLVVQLLGLAAWVVASIACARTALPGNPRKLRHIRRRLRAGDYDSDDVLDALTDRILADGQMQDD